MWCASQTRLDTLRDEIAGYDRDDLIARILNFPSRTALDFTRDYLEQQTTDRLQHLLLCAMTYLPSQHH